MKGPKGLALRSQNNSTIKKCGAKITQLYEPINYIECI